MSYGGRNSKITLLECKKMLNVNGENYSDEQVILIRDWLYRIAEIALESDEREEQKLDAISQEILNKGKP